MINKTPRIATPIHLRFHLRLRLHLKVFMRVMQIGELNQAMQGRSFSVLVRPQRNQAPPAQSWLWPY